MVDLNNRIINSEFVHVAAEKGWIKKSRRSVEDVAASALLMESGGQGSPSDVRQQASLTARVFKQSQNLSPPPSPQLQQMSFNEIIITLPPRLPTEVLLSLKTVWFGWITLFNPCWSEDQTCVWRFISAHVGCSEGDGYQSHTRSRCYHVCHLVPIKSSFVPYQPSYTARQLSDCWWGLVTEESVSSRLELCLCRCSVLSQTTFQPFSCFIVNHNNPETSQNAGFLPCAGNRRWSKETKALLTKRGLKNRSRNATESRLNWEILSWSFVLFISI